MPDAVVIDGTNAEAVSREGSRAAIALPALLDKLIPPPAMDTLDLVLPDGVKAVRTRGRVTILVHETTPAKWNFKWIAADSKSQFGPGTKYRQVCIALPYVITFCVFRQEPPLRRLVLSAHNECFFRREPLHRLDDGELCYPALLNCSKFPVERGRPLAWICTEHLDYPKLAEIEDDNDRLRASFRTLMETLFGSAFNHSSEAHEGASWFTETIKKKVDPRVSSIERWQSETEKDATFALEVPWLSTGKTVAQMIDRIFGLAREPGGSSNGDGKVKSSDDIARIIFNHA
jgi:hypothetical protein